MIKALLNSGKRYSSQTLELYFDRLMAPKTDDYRVAFLVSSAAGGAVERNRLKRWMREDFRKIQDEKRIPGGFVLKFKGSAEQATHRLLSVELEKLFRFLEANEQS